MQCPFCGAEMKKGYVFTTKNSGLHWLPENSKTPGTLSRKAIDSRGGETIIPYIYLGWKPPTAPSWICRSCRKAYIDYSMTEE